MENSKIKKESTEGIGVFLWYMSRGFTDEKMLKVSQEFVHVKFNYFMSEFPAKENLVQAINSKHYD